MVLLVIAPVLSADLGACCCPEDRACCCAPASNCRETEIEMAPNLIWSQAALPPQSERLIVPALIATADQPSPLDQLHNQRPDLARRERPPPQRPPPLTAMTVLRL